MLIWGNKKYVVDKLIADNGFENVKCDVKDEEKSDHPPYDADGQGAVNERKEGGENVLFCGKCGIFMWYWLKSKAENLDDSRFF